MKKFSTNRDRGSGIGDRGLLSVSSLQSLVPILLTITIFTLYLSTLAQTLVLGDPTEFTFIANILGIAHPPGYVFITLLGKLFQTVIPFGFVAWRMHLLSATAGTAASMFVYGTIRTLTRPDLRSLGDFVSLTSYLPAIFGALTVATAVNHWQHAIHTNPHIITATFLAANFYFLTKWAKGDGASSTIPLYSFCFSAGLGVTHHPLTVMAFPAYALFIVWKRPFILRDWRTLLKMVAVALLGLLPWLYYPLRSPSAPFGPTSMNTVSGFLDHILARGLSDSLPYFPLAEQPLRTLVFWSILRLQYSLPTILLALFALISTAKGRGHEGANRPITPSLHHSITLFTLAFLTTYAFVISLRQQDIMAYLLGPLLIVGLLSGVGMLQLFVWLQKRLRGDLWPLWGLTAVFFLLGPILQIGRNLPRVSLRNYTEAADYVNAIDERFGETGEGATLLNDWERMTPLWYEQYVNGNVPNPDDVSLEYIAAGSNPWLEGVFNFLGGGPVYLSNFRQTELGGTEFRQRPNGRFYQVVEPGDVSIPGYLTRHSATAGEIEIVGSYLGETAVTAGDFVPLTIAMRSPSGTSDFYIPVLTVGEITYEFTTDSHLVTPNWRPNEVIIERFDFALPFDLPAGDYPLTLNIKNLSQNELIETSLNIGALTVAESPTRVRTSHLLANFRQRVGLVNAAVWKNGRRTRAPWSADQAIQAKPGDTLNIILEWEALARPEESYTIFVHLNDTANQPRIALDYTPLGGSTPTHLWIPKWLPGQRFTDPYRMVIPQELPPGQYYIEVGLYEFIGQRRLHISDQNGNLTGDRYILGTVEIRE